MAADKKLRIGMFPWLAFGHIIPYLELSKRIAQKGHHVFFISTPLNIDRLPKLDPHLSPFISFVKLPLPSIDNLPENAEATIDIPYDKVQFLKKSFDELKESLVEFLRSSDLDWILHDFAPYWLKKEIVGSELKAKTAYFCVFSPQGLAFVGSTSGDEYRINIEDYTVPPKWIPFPTTVVFRYFEIKKIFDSFTGNVTGITDINRMKKSLDVSDLVVVRGCPHFHQEWLQVLRHLHDKPILPIGQLPTTEYDSGEETPAWKSIKQWLDKQDKSSAVYVAFGSEAKPSQDQLTEIAFGLELSKLPFFWVLRTRLGPTDPDLIELPVGFEERTRERGIVCTSWAPQLKILAHDSVGGFLTHSGWSSVVEAIQFERALILLTFMADQGLIARVLEEKRMGFCIPRNDMDGSFTRNAVSESLKMVMVEEEGKIYRERVKEMKDLFVNSEKEEKLIDEFLEYLKSH
nr:UGT91A1 [Gynostemma pentaphyllum]